MGENDRLIVYVEDDPEMVTLVTMILKPKGFDVKGANGGSEALKIIPNIMPDLILLDLMMPEMDGWEVFHRLKSIEKTSKIPIIIITAKSQEIDKVLGLNIAKVDDYIIKPFHYQQLIDSIQRIFDKKDIPPA
jgi:two-component system, OmpR family, response regulator VicR